MAESTHRRFEVSLTEIVAAREFLRQTLRSHERLDDLLVIVSELVTNAVQHAATPFEVGIDRGDALTRVQVTDGGPDWLRSAPAPTSGKAGGRGLMIVAALADRWGVDDGTPGAGKTVWAELDGGAIAR